jgi:hypothetical protein
MSAPPYKWQFPANPSALFPKEKESWYATASIECQVEAAVGFRSASANPVTCIVNQKENRSMSHESNAKRLIVRSTSAAVKQNLAGSLGFVIAVAFLTVIVTFASLPSACADAASAMQRIRSGPHSSMPMPETATAYGNEGEGMTIQNGTNKTLYVYFVGPVQKTVVIKPGATAGVSLVVGNYEVAVEIPNAHVTPFYGKQSYKSDTHYWLKFFLRSE